MNKSYLYLVIKRFDNVIKDVDFKNLPQKDSAEYRYLLFRVANDVIFVKRRYNGTSEWLIELFDIKEVREAIIDLKEINALKDSERTRLCFYLDIKELCYPLLKCKDIDLTRDPWGMQDDRLSVIENRELMSFIHESPYRRVVAVLLDGIVKHHIDTWEMKNAVVQDTLSTRHQYMLEDKDWSKEEELNKGIEEVTDELWEVENHMELGKRMGLNHTAQSIYDMIDTFIAERYDYRQVDCARELGAWIDEHESALHMRHPAQEDVDALWRTMKDTVEKYHLSFVNERMTWNYITLEMLEMSMFSEEQEKKWEEEDDDDFWED